MMPAPKRLALRRAVGIGGLVALVLLVGWGVRRTVGSASRPASGRGASGEVESADANAGGVSSRSHDSAARRVRAVVVDDDGDPLEGGHVSLRCLADGEVTGMAGNTVVLDEDGGFEGPGCIGQVCVELHHPSAIPAEPWVIEPGVPGVLRATSLPRLRGMVVDSRSRPVAAARISVGAALDADPDALIPTIGTNTTTDAEGQFSFALIRRGPCDPCTEADRGCDDLALALQERVVVAIHAPQFGPARVELDVDANSGDNETPQIRLMPPADVISGTLLDPHGDPYPRATILARASQDPTEQHQSSPQEHGFAFESLGSGPYDLRALQDGVELATAMGVRPGEDIELVGSMVASGPDVDLEITYDGEPQAGVTVDGGPFRGARTDLNGQVRADAAMPGEYTLSLRRPGAGLVRQPLVIPPRPEPPSDEAAATRREPRTQRPVAPPLGGIRLQLRLAL